MKPKHSTGPQRWRRTTSEGKRSSYTLTVSSLLQVARHLHQVGPSGPTVYPVRKKRAQSGHPALPAPHNISRETQLVLINVNLGESAGAQPLSIRQRPRRGGAYSNLHSDPGGSPSYGNSSGEEIPPSSALLQLNQMLKQLDTLTSDVSYRWS